MKSKCDGARQLTLIRTKWFRLLLVVWWHRPHSFILSILFSCFFCMLFFLFIIFMAIFLAYTRKCFMRIMSIDVSWRACIISSISMEWMDAKKGPKFLKETCLPSFFWHHVKGDPCRKMDLWSGGKFSKWVLYFSTKLIKSSFKNIDQLIIYGDSKILRWILVFLG